MLRALALLPVALAAAVPSCAGGRDAQRAQALLVQEQQAFARLRTMTFSMRVWSSGAPKDVTVTMSGAALLRGPGAGDFVLDMRVEGLPQAVSRSVHKGAVTCSGIGSTRFCATGPASGGVSPAQFDWTPFVQGASVHEHETLAGAPVTRLVGKLDVGALGTLSKSGQSLPGLDGKLGRTRAVLYLSETSHLLVRALFDVSLGKHVEMHIDYALTGTDTPVEIPAPTTA